MSTLKYIEIDNFELQSGKTISFRLSYQNFGQDLYTAPVVLVNHALTGNSKVTGENGWWNAIIGPDKVVDTNTYSVLAFNIPGNGYSGLREDFTVNYKQFVADDIARLFNEGLRLLGINQLYAIIGGSVGGGLAWHMALLRPNLAKHIIPIATDWKATDWLIANCYVQERILENSLDPIADARAHAMTFYRTPESFQQKFNRTKREQTIFNVESWINHHGERLTQRFKLTAYKMMNQILKTINVAENISDFLEQAKKVKGNIHLVTINSDLFFKPEENWNTYFELSRVKKNVSISEIKSIHGHDAFLIEYNQLSKILKPIFNLKKEEYDNSQSHYIWNR